METHQHMPDCYCSGEVEWRPIIRFKRYEVSNYGDVRTLVRGAYKILRPTPNYEGRRQLNLLSYDGEYKKEYVYRVVGFTFDNFDPTRPAMNHIDCNCSHYHAANLQWTTTKENNDARDPPDYSNRSVRPVLQLNVDTGDVIMRFPSIIVAARTIRPCKKFKSTPTNIGNACRNENKTAYRYKWRYDEPELDGEVFEPIDPYVKSLKVFKLIRCLMCYYFCFFLEST